MERWAEWLTGLGTPLGPYGPKVLGALALVLVGWLASRVARLAVRRLCARAGLETRLEMPGMADTLGAIAAGGVWLLVLPGVLETLQLQGLLVPVNVMVSRLMGFVPNLVGTAVVFGVGFLAARIVRQVVTGLLRAAGSERVAGRLGLTESLGEQGLAGVAGSVAFALILLPVLVAALEPLQLNAVTQPVSRLLDTLVGLIPRLVAAALIVAVGAVAGRVLARVVTGALAGMGVDRWARELDLPAVGGTGGRALSEWLGSGVFLALVLLSVTQASEVIGVTVLTEAVARLGGVLARLVSAAVVAVAGLWVSARAAQAVRAWDVPRSARWAAVVRWAVLFFTGALVLRQAGLPADIVTIAFASVMGALGVGAALALGLGGQHMVARLLDEAWRAVRDPSRGAREDDPTRPDPQRPEVR